MQQLEIMSGFTHIKSVFRTKCKITKPAHELALWFTYTGNMLHVHDIEKHETSIPLALIETGINKDWQILLKPNSPGTRLLEYAISRNDQNPHVELNNQYGQLGNIPFRLLK